ncbi:PucR family transcriptional regulator [Nocardia higoensis]|uniref:PucR family transcriptional regulator n=1 Tax=Nocardia higoensis TaxID=228599 RepID=UPI0002FE28E4|nr:helix-turn-helix domain-containing protein [Nocardia higoensis]
MTPPDRAEETPSAVAGPLVACRAEIPALTRRLLVAIFTDNPEWTDYSPVTRADLQDGCRRYLSRILDLLERGGPTAAGDDVAESIGRERAQQGVPLEVMLRTFRLGGRIVWEALATHAEDIDSGEFREIGTATWAVIDSLSSSLVTAYRHAEHERVRFDERRRHVMVEDLLAGRAHDPAFVTRAARTLNLPIDGPYLVVAAARGANPVLRVGAETALTASGVRCVWHERDQFTVGLIAVGGLGVPATLDHIRGQLSGRAGASLPVSGLAGVSIGHAQALVALETLPAAEQRLVSLDERYPEALLVRAPDVTEALVDSILGPVLELPSRERDTLLETLDAWLAHGCSAANAAPRLNCHRNTVINRLNRISSLLDRPLETQRCLLELSLALAALRLRAR